MSISASTGIKRWTITPQAGSLADLYASTDMEMTDLVQPEELDSQITDLVEQHWRENQTPLLLSRLGSHGGGEIARQEHITKGWEIISAIGSWAGCK